MENFNKILNDEFGNKFSSGQYCKLSRYGNQPCKHGKLIHTHHQCFLTINIYR